MKTETETQRAAPATGSESYCEIGLVGGTVIRIQPGRGADAAYDHLLAALKNSKTFNGKAWQDEWMEYAKVIRPIPLNEIPPSPPNDRGDQREASGPASG